MWVLRAALKEEAEIIVTNTWNLKCSTAYMWLSPLQQENRLAMWHSPGSKSSQTVKRFKSHVAHVHNKLSHSRPVDEQSKAEVNKDILALAPTEQCWFIWQKIKIVLTLKHIWTNCAVSASPGTLPSCLQLTTLNISLNWQINPIQMSLIQ